MFYLTFPPQFCRVVSKRLLMLKKTELQTFKWCSSQDFSRLETAQIFANTYSKFLIAYHLKICLNKLTFLLMYNWMMKKAYKTIVNLLTSIFSVSEELFNSLIVQFRSILQEVLEIALIIQIWIPLAGSLLISAPSFIAIGWRSL